MKNFVQIKLSTQNQFLATLHKKSFDLVVYEENRKSTNFDWTPNVDGHASKVIFIRSAPHGFVKILPPSSVLKLINEQQKLLSPKCITFPRLYHFSQYKTTSLLCIQSKNSRNGEFLIATYKFPTPYPIHPQGNHSKHRDKLQNASQIFYSKQMLWISVYILVSTFPLKRRFKSITKLFMSELALGKLKNSAPICVQSLNVTAKMWHKNNRNRQLISLTIEMSQLQFKFLKKMLQKLLCFAFSILTLKDIYS